MYPIFYRLQGDYKGLQVLDRVYGRVRVEVLGCIGFRVLGVGFTVSRILGCQVLIESFAKSEILRGTARILFASHRAKGPEGPHIKMPA